MLLRLVVLSIFVMVAGCVASGKLSPTNDLARRTGVLPARFTIHDNGLAEIEVTLPDGEVATGEVREGSVGGIYRSVNGTANALPGGHPGIAALFGNRGTSIFCEGYFDTINGHGTGSCRSFTGALYQFQY
jgi:hypothetical protein